MTHDILLVAVAAGVTMATRFLPFLIFPFANLFQSI